MSMASEVGSSVVHGGHARGDNDDRAGGHGDPVDCACSPFPCAGAADADSDSVMHVGVVAFLPTIYHPRKSCAA